MKMEQHRIRLRKIPMLIVFIIGIFMGIFLVKSEKSSLLDSEGMLDVMSLCTVQQFPVNNKALFLFVFIKRMFSCFALLILLYVSIGAIVCTFYILWCGMGLGAVFTLAGMRYGVKGILLIVVSLFPQFFVYIPAIYMLMYKRIRLPESVGIVVLIFIGCVAEAFWNPGLLQGFLKIF
ncbi:MAG: stage II sporulation protein M [Acetatifactor sp.]|nr:stage II sporulation protein M [Acetatifactor sp.]